MMRQCNLNLLVATGAVVTLPLQQGRRTTVLPNYGGEHKKKGKVVMNAGTTGAVKAGATARASALTINVQGIESKHLEKVKEYGLQIVSKTGELAGLYLTLCTYIRQNHVDAKLVSYELSQIGFRKQRITEINRVAYAPPDVWKQYEARALGFDKTLVMARVSSHPGASAGLTPSGQQLLDQGAITKAEAKEAINAVVKANGHGQRKTPRKTAQRDAARRAGWANNIMDTLTPEMKFPLVFKRGDYIVTVTYEPKVPGKAPPK